MGDAQSAQRDGTSEAEVEEQSAVQGGPSGDSTHDKLIQNNGQISDINGKSDETVREVKDHCEENIIKEAITVKNKLTSVTKSEPAEVTNVQIIDEELPDANEGEPVEILNVDTKQNDLNESFKKFFSNIGLKLTVKRGVADKADDDGEKEIETLEAVEETASQTKYEDVEQITDLNPIQDSDSTTCPTLTDGTPEDVAEIIKEKMNEEKEIAIDMNVVNEHDGVQDAAAAAAESKPNQEDGEFVSPIKKFFTTGIFAGLAKKKKEEEELVHIGQPDAAEEQQEIAEASTNVAEQEEFECKDIQAEEVTAIEVPEDVRGKSPSTDQDSEPEITSSQEKAQSSPFKRLFSGTSFKRRSKRQKRRKSSDAKLSDSGENIETKIVASSEKAEQQDMAEQTPSPLPPPTTEPEEELSAWEAFKKLMTPKKSFKRPSEETQVPAATVEETKPSEEERISDHSTEEGRKRKDSSHSWEAVLCGSGRRRSRKTSDSEDEHKENGGQVESQNEAGDVVTSMPKQAASPSDSESSTWKSFKKLMTPKRKVKEDDESKDNAQSAQSDSEATQEETLFSLRKLLPGRKKKQDQLSSDEGDREAVSVEEDSETPAVVPLSEFDQSETEDTAKTDTEIEESKLESEQELILEIPKTFVQEVQEHQVTPIIALNQDQDELTEFSKYQPLSDIPEEGNITETVATSLIEEVAKDDTIAEDMVEITSEAITAPEPVDVTMADETDELMLSAASHLPESSKTSGNATPVPAEYDVRDTDILLKEVVETICTATEVDTLCLEQPSLERVAGSVSHASVTEEQNVMGIQAQSEAVTIETVLQVDRRQDTDIENPATALSESLSEFKDAVSTENVSEVSKVEFESARVDVDEVHITQRAVKQESIDDSEYMIESLSEVPESTEIIFQDPDEVQDVFRAECLEGETKVESPEPLLEENVDAIDNIGKQITEIQDLPIPSQPELPKAEVDYVLDKCKEKESIQEDEAMVEPNAKIDQPSELVQTESEEKIDLQSLDGATELVKEVTQELPNEQALWQFQEGTITSAEVETVAEDFEIANKQDEEGTQEPIPESQNLPVQELAVQEEQDVPLSGLAKREEIIDHKDPNQPKQEISENDQDILKGHICDINEAVNKAEVPVTAATTEQEGRDLPVSGVQEVVDSEVIDATHNLLEEAIEAKLIEGTVPLVDEEIMEQKVEEVAREVGPQDSCDELEEQQLLPEAAADEIDVNIEEQEATKGQEQEMSLEMAGASSAKERKVVFKLDHALEINGEHTEVNPSMAQVMQVDHSHEASEELEALPVVHVSSIDDDSGIAQVLEDTADLEKSSELFLSITEEPIHEVHIGETEVRLEEYLEEEIPCTATELANTEQAAMLKESMVTSEQVSPTLPDFVIQKTVEDAERISEETSIPCVDNAEVLDEPKQEVQLSEIQEVGIQGEKEGEIAPLATSHADVQYALVAQTTTCSFKDVASGIPDVSIETTMQTCEPVEGTVASEQEHNESIETTTPLEVNNVTQVAEEGKIVVLMHVPSRTFEDNDQVQVQVVGVDIESAETRVDAALEIGVQEDKEVVDTCNETVEKVDSFSATSEIEQEMVCEKDKVIIQEVFQHVKEIAPDSKEEPEHKEPPSDSVDGELSEDRNIIAAQDEEDVVAAMQDVVMATKDEVHTKMDEEEKEVQKPPNVENQGATPSNTAVAVPQNTGIISSSGNVEAPSSLSLEFKLNIHFGQSKAPILPSPPTTTERTISSSPLPQSPTAPPFERRESPKSIEMVEAGVQAVNVESKQENEQQKLEIILAEAAVQATETAEESDLVETVEQVLVGAWTQSTETEELFEEVKATEMTQNKTILMDAGTQSTEIVEQIEEKSIKMKMTENQQVLIDVGIQSMQQEDLREKNKILEEESPSIQTAEIVQSDKESRKTEAEFTELVDRQVSANPVKETEDEDEIQDVWLDAEEDIDGQEEIRTMPQSEIEDSFESQPDYFQETKSDFEESFDNIKKTLKCDSEEEDFSAALEDPQIGKAIATMEWD